MFEGVEFFLYILILFVLRMKKIEQMGEKKG